MSHRHLPPILSSTPAVEVTVLETLFEDEEMRAEFEAALTPPTPSPRLVQADIASIFQRQIDPSRPIAKAPLPPSSSSTSVKARKPRRCVVRYIVNRTKHDKLHHSPLIEFMKASLYEMVRKCALQPWYIRLCQYHYHEGHTQYQRYRSLIVSAIYHTLHLIVLEEMHNQKYSQLPADLAISMLKEIMRDWYYRLYGLSLDSQAEQLNLQGVNVVEELAHYLSEDYVEMFSSIMKLVDSGNQLTFVDNV